MVMITCPYCDFASDDLEEFELKFCPSEPDKCNGCEIDEYSWLCPDCLNDWPRKTLDKLEKIW